MSSCVRLLIAAYTCSLVRILAIADRADLDQRRGIIDAIEDSVVPDTDAPEIGGAAQLLAAAGTRRGDERIELSRDASQHRIGYCVELLARRAGETELVHAIRRT